MSHDLTLAPGASIDSNGQTLTVTGNLDAGNTITGTGTVVLTPGNATLSGSVPNLIINGGSHTLSGPVTVNGNLNIAGPASLALDSFALSVTGRLSGSNVPTITGPGPMTVGDVTVTALNLVNVAFTIDIAPGALMTSFINVNFIGYAPDVTRLTIRGPGRATPYTFSGLDFDSAPAAGFAAYVDATDTVPIDPNILTIRLTGATPADGSAAHHRHRRRRRRVDRRCAERGHRRDAHGQSGSGHGRTEQFSSRSRSPTPDRSPRRT